MLTVNRRADGKGKNSPDRGRAVRGIKMQFDNAEEMGYNLAAKMRVVRVL